MTGYFVWLLNHFLASTGDAIGYALPALVAAYVARKGWDLAGKR